MKALLVVLASATMVPAAAAATREAHCEKLKEQMRRIEEAKRETKDQGRLHKLEARRQKVLAGQAKYKC